MQNASMRAGNAAKRKPVILMSMGSQSRSGHDYQVMTNKYINPIVQIADCVPILVPTAYGPINIDQYLDMADGVYITGAATNIDPALYGQDNKTPEKPMDRTRDLFDIPLILAALERGLPLFGVCRGMQELNVALGGDLHQKVYTLPGMRDHRENPQADVPGQYADVHEVRPIPGSWYAELMQVESFQVNSLHGQGLNKLGKGIEPAAYSEDGLVEVVHAWPRRVHAGCAVAPRMARHRKPELRAHVQGVRKGLCRMGSGQSHLRVVRINRKGG